MPTPDRRPDSDGREGRRAEAVGELRPVKQAGFVIPGYAYPAGWNTPPGARIPSAIAAIGGNTAVLQTTFTAPSTTSVNIDTSTGVSRDGIVAMVRAARAAGLRVALKPHVQPVGDIQSHLVPGAFVSSNTASFRAGRTELTLPGAACDDSWIGRRVVSPAPGHEEEIPSGLTADRFGHATPRWTTITRVADRENVILSAAANASSDTGYLVIPDDIVVESWFSAYRDCLDDLLETAASVGGVDLLVVSTEHEVMHVLWDDRWRQLIAYLRDTWPAVNLTMGDAATNGYHAIRCWDVLDVVGLSYYLPVESGPSADGELTLAAHRRHLLDLEAFGRSWGKDILMTEVGYRSTAECGCDPSRSTGGTADGGVAQARCVEALFEAYWGQPWFAGFHWWTWSHPQDTRPRNEVVSFAPDRKPAQAVFSKYLLDDQNRW